MKVYIITYCWRNEMAGGEDGVLDVFFDLEEFYSVTLHVKEVH